MFAKLNTSSVFSLRLSMPRQGAWTCDVETDSDIALSGTLDLTFGDGAVFRGTVVHGDSIHGRFTAQLVGGNGFLSKVIGSKAYSNCPLILPLRDIATASGEALDASTDASPALLVNVTRWLRRTAKASICLDELALEASSVWRVTSDGKIYLGVDSYEASKVVFSVMRDIPQLNAQELAAETLIVPGVSLGGRPVVSVEHVLAGNTFRSTVFYG